MKNFINISTSFLRVLPNYLIIGAQKTGTSSLFNYLSMHPQVINSNKKEVHYFDKNFERPLNWYKQFFPFKFIANNYTIGEATPDYLYHPFVAQRIYNTIPGVKLIIILRNIIIRDITENVIFTSSIKENEDISFSKNGIYNGFCLLPANIFNVGKFFIYPYFANIIKREVIPIKDFISFRTISKENSNNEINKYMGPCRIKVEWKPENKL